MLTLPIASLQATSNNPKRSFVSIFQFRLTTFKSHPSGISPSKKVPKITAKVGASSDQGAVKITADNQKTYAGHVWDETNKAVITPAVDSYVVPETNAYYLCPCLKLEPADSETEFTETELPAVTIFLKKDTQTDHEWLPRKQTHEITTAKYYGVALTNEAKAVVGKFKA